MGKIVREVYYFDEPGPQNTDDVIEIVVKYLDNSNVDCVLVASTSGKTALKFAEALKNKEVKVICVSEPPLRQMWGGTWPAIDDDTKKKLEELGVIVLDRIPYKFHGSVMELSKWKIPVPEHIMRDTLAFVGGQGLKVAVEIMFMTVQGGYVEVNKEVISVGGSGGGADTAIVVKTCHPEAIFSPEKDKKLEVREILAMPRKKKWW
ncbi:MAG: hypothetical protein NDF54_10640 [archaeon GB-1867-035]|nr:hypothetical protein [Candidatus Culexmicrobium profundum]